MAPSVSERSRALPHAAIERHLALLPLYITAAFLWVQLAVLLAPSGARDAEGLVKGHDFSHFYTLGTVARTGRPADLYDPRALTETMWRTVPETRPGAFAPVYGPQVALAFAPLAALPYVTAVWAWLAVSASLYLASCALMVSLLPGLHARRVTLWVLLAGSPAFNVLLVSGQTSAVALLAVVLAWWALERRRPWIAGLCLGLLAYKPSLMVGVLAVLALAGEWKVLGGMALTAVGQLLVGALWAGAPVMKAYARALAQPARAAGMVVSQPEHLHSLAGAARLLIGPGWLSAGVYVVSAAIIVVLAGWGWRRRTDAASRLALLATAGVLAAPHLYVYDLVLLVPALAVLWDRSERAAPPWRARGWGAAWLGWLAPLGGPIALATHVQWSIPVHLAVLALLGRPTDTSDGGRS